MLTLKEILNCPYIPPSLPPKEYTVPTTEADPNHYDQHQPGAKLDAGKIRPSLVLGGFARALVEVTEVGTFGASKYSDDGWMEVPEGEKRYLDAQLRHYLKEASGEEYDPETGFLHAAHGAWNALARLDLILRRKDLEEVELDKT